MKTNELKRVAKNFKMLKLEKNDLGVLQKILIESKNGRVTFTGTNLTESYRRTLNTKVAMMQDFKIMVDAEDFIDTVKNLDSVATEFRVTEDQLHLHSDMIYKINSFDNVYDFPEHRKRTGEVEKVKFSKKLMNEIFDSFSFSTFKNKSDYYGIYFNPTEDKVEIVSTDIHRLTYGKTDRIYTKNPFYLQVDCMKNVIAIMQDFNKFDLSDDFAFFTGEDEEFIFHTKDNRNFPNYHGIVLTEVESSYTVDAKDLEKKTQKIYNMRKKKERLVAVHATFNGITKTLRIESVDTEAKFPIKGSNNMWSVNLNVKYINDYLKTIKTDEVVVSQRKSDLPYAPVTFMEMNNELEIRHIIMPVRV